MCTVHTIHIVHIKHVVNITRTVRSVHVVNAIIFDCLARLKQLMQILCTKFRTCLPIDEMFNRGKHNIASSSNTRCTPERIWAVVLDKEVMSGLNHFDEVDRNDVTPVRAQTLDHRLFHANTNKKKMTDAMKVFNPGSIVSRKEATWFSPAASNVRRPFCDIKLARMCQLLGDVSLMQYSWLCRLCTSRLLIRKKGTFAWSLCLGNVCQAFVEVWHPVEFHDSVWTPCKSGTVKSVAIVDLKSWESVPLQPVSPKHIAVKRCSLTDSPTEFACLKSPELCGAMMVSARALDRHRPLDQTQARQGFGDLGSSFLLSLCTYYELEPESNSLFDVLTCLINHIIPAPELTEDLLKHIYTTRQVAMEPGDDQRSLLELEDVLDSFDEHDRTRTPLKLYMAFGCLHYYQQHTTSNRQYAICYKHLYNMQHAICSMQYATHGGAAHIGAPRG